MNFRNIILSLIFTGALVGSYLARYTLGQLTFELIFFGTLVIGGGLLARNFMTKEISYDERTAYIAGKAAKSAILGTFLLGLAILLYVDFMDRPTSASGVIAIMLGVMTIIYTAAYAYFSKQ